MIQVEQILVSGWPGLINNISRRVNNYSSPDVGQGNWIRQFFKTYLALSLIRTMPVMQATASPLGYCVTFLGLNCYSQSNVTWIFNSCLVFLLVLTPSLLVYQVCLSSFKPSAFVANKTLPAKVKACSIEMECFRLSDFVDSTNRMSIHVL